MTSRERARPPFRHLTEGIPLSIFLAPETTLHRSIPFALQWKFKVSSFYSFSFAGQKRKRSRSQAITSQVGIQSVAGREPKCRRWAKSERTWDAARAARPFCVAGGKGFSPPATVGPHTCDGNLCHLRQRSNIFATVTGATCYSRATHPQR